MPDLQDHVDKVEEEITLYVENLKIVGHMHRHTNVRFSDEWNREHREFVPLTHCTISDRSTTETVEAPFLMVRREHVDLVFPKSGGGQTIPVEEGTPEKEEEPGKSKIERDSLTNRLRRLT